MVRLEATLALLDRHISLHSLSSQNVGGKCCESITARTELSARRAGLYASAAFFGHIRSVAEAQRFVHLFA